MRKFVLIWFGQLVSTIGSYMSEFALTLWAWSLTGSATALALVGFFSLRCRSKLGYTLRENYQLQ